MSTSQQIVTITFFRYKGWKNKWWAFQQMGLAPEQLVTIPSLSFSKLLGSGAGKGFSVAPNFAVYGLLCVWDNEMVALNNFANHMVFQD